MTDSYIGTVRRGTYRVARVKGEMAGVELTGLNPRLDLANHSPDGFAWGYGGSGPSQLALAILADATGNDAMALEHYQAFRDHIIAAFDKDESWELEHSEVMAALYLCERAKADRAHYNAHAPEAGK